MKFATENIRAVFEAALPLYGDREAHSIARLFAERRPHTSEQDLADIAAARPVQYILGVADFYGLELAVGEGALIPRPETEELVRWMIDDLCAESRLPSKVPGFRAARRILDIGTGPGTIALALAKNLPEAHLAAIDISEKALEFARQNATKYLLEVDFRRADILDPMLEIGTFDTIVSNPPYIPESEKSSIHDNVKLHEPGSALFVPNDDPLVFYRAIAKFALRALSPGGALYLEIHENFAPQTAEMLRRQGFADIEIRSDLNSKPRMVKCINPNAKRPPNKPLSR